MKQLIISIMINLMLFISISAQSGKQGSFYKFLINDFSMPMDNKGILADVDSIAEKNGRYQDIYFLFSGGFLMSGFCEDTLWANGVASASYIFNYEPGPVGSGYDTNAVIYVIDINDEPFGQSWIDWEDAVAIGAWYYDGDNDGEYNPVDLNNNSLWDTNEDKPALLGDKMAFCVYNDSEPLSTRTRFGGISPMGIEIRQYLYGYYSTEKPYSNVLFVLYEIVNNNPDNSSFTDVIFGIWGDPDVGFDHQNDLTGCDRDYSAGYIYHLNTIDKISLLVSSYSPDNPENYFSSYIHYQGDDPDLGDPDNAVHCRNYNLGKHKFGYSINPCDWELGNNPARCDTISDRYWYSGDPVQGTGWLNTRPTDQRMMINVGPFNLGYGETKKITATYVIGEGDTCLAALTDARETINALIGNVMKSEYEIIPKPRDYALSQNFPNPFNPETTIQFSIPERTYIKLSVTNVLGEVVEVLISEDKPAG